MMMEDIMVVANCLTWQNHVQSINRVTTFEEMHSHTKLGMQKRLIHVLPKPPVANPSTASSSCW
jgi:hypothetical protein